MLYYCKIKSKFQWRSISILSEMWNNISLSRVLIENPLEENIPLLFLFFLYRVIFNIIWNRSYKWSTTFTQDIDYCVCLTTCSHFRSLPLTLSCPIFTLQLQNQSFRNILPPFLLFRTMFRIRVPRFRGKYKHTLRTI